MTTMHFESHLFFSSFEKQPARIRWSFINKEEANTHTNRKSKIWVTSLFPETELFLDDGETREKDTCNIVAILGLVADLGFILEYAVQKFSYRIW
jgi:hypothetical protein